MVKYNVKSSFWQKHDIFSQFMRSFCTWHFLENMFKRCRFWRKCLMKKCRKIEKIKNVIFDMKIKNRITTRYYFCLINTFWYPWNHFFGFLKLYLFGIILVYFWYTSSSHCMYPLVNQGPRGSGAQGPMAQKNQSPSLGGSGRPAGQQPPSPCSASINLAFIIQQTGCLQNREIYI